MTMEQGMTIGFEFPDEETPTNITLLFRTNIKTGDTEWNGDVLYEIDEESVAKREWVECDIADMLNDVPEEYYLSFINTEIKDSYIYTIIFLCK